MNYLHRLSGHVIVLKQSIATVLMIFTDVSNMIESDSAALKFIYARMFRGLNNTKYCNYYTIKGIVFITNSCFKYLRILHIAKPSVSPGYRRLTSRFYPTMNSWYATHAYLYPGCILKTHTRMPITTVWERTMRYA